jgi:TolA-binding protein
MIDQKDVEIHNLKEELEYIKQELRQLQQANTSLRDSLQEKRDTFGVKTTQTDDDNDNLRIYHQTIENDHRLSQEIINELKGLPASAAAPASSSPFEDDTAFRSRYNLALNQYFDGQITLSLQNFRALLQQRQDHPLSDNCQYWIGEGLYSQEKYPEAIAAFRKSRNWRWQQTDAALFKVGELFKIE